MRKFVFSILAFTFLIVASGGSAMAGDYWADWPEGKAKGPMPPCGVNVLPLGGDAILQATVDIYCGVEPGDYKSYINPKAMKAYKAKAKYYPDGKTGVLVFKKIGLYFSTDHKGGKPIYDVKKIGTGESAASSEPGHPLNPETCAKCHASFDGVCTGYVCGNRMF